MIQYSKENGLFDLAKSEVGHHIYSSIKNAIKELETAQPSLPVEMKCVLQSWASVNLFASRQRPRDNLLGHLYYICSMQKVTRQKATICDLTHIVTLASAQF